MVDQLLASTTPTLPADAAANLRRLEAMLASGQPRTAQVVQSTPQPLPGQPATAQQGAVPAPTNTATTAPPATSANPAPAAGATSGAPATPASQPAPVNSDQLFRVQIRLQGRLFELITNKPLEPGSQVQLSRGSNQQITLQPLPVNIPGEGKPAAGQQQPGQTGQQSAVSSQPGRSAALPTSPATTTPAAPNTARPATTQVNINTATATASTPTVNANNPPAKTTASSQPAAPSPGNPGGSTASATRSTANTPGSTTPASQAAPAKPTVQAATERVQLQPLSQPPALKPGQRLNAEVISSRPMPAANPVTPASASQPGAKAPAPSTPATTSTAAAPRAEPAASGQSDNQNFRIRINLQGQRLDLVSPRPIPAGSQIQLSQTPQGHIQAELPSAKTQAIEQVLREHLPQQQPPSALLNLISAAQSTGQLQQAKPVLLNLIQLLTGRSLSSPQQTDAETVRQQVNNSGSLLENKLARGDTQNLSLDQKVLLLKLSQQLGQPSSQRELPQSLSERLMQLTQQTLSRVLVNQVTSLGAQPQDSNIEPNRALVLDIPILWQEKTENLQLKIQREAQDNDDDSDQKGYRWQVRLHFEIEQSRVLQADLTLEGERISVIWSGDRQLRQQVQGKLDDLQQQLEDIGLEINVLGVREQDADTNNSPKPPRNQLIDIQT